jgi:pyroglutamyl-peptidase
LPHALITGFGPFPGVPRNPSGMLAQRLAAAPRWQRLGWSLQGITFPTGYDSVTREIAGIGAKGTAPRFILMLGVAARARWLRVELRARNHVSATHRDASGARPAGFRLDASPDVIRKGRHPGVPLVDALRGGRVPARLSRDTGRYVCNAAYWTMLGRMGTGTEVVFVHIPMPRRPGIRKRDPRPSMLAMERALMPLVQLMMKRARFKP